MDGSCPSDLFFLKIDGAGEDGPRAIGEGISRPFPPNDEQVTVQNHFAVSRSIIKRQITSAVSTVEKHFPRLL
jgi:hypothetical protein